MFVYSLDWIYADAGTAADKWPYGFVIFSLQAQGRQTGSSRRDMSRNLRGQ